MGGGGVVPSGSPFAGGVPSLAAPGVKPVQAGQLNTGLGGFGSLMQGFNTPFVAPTGATEQNDPGYQFRLQQGQQALERSAAAKGDLLGGATGKALGEFGQNYASNEYNNVYNRALQQYQQQYNIFSNNQANAFNRLADVAGIGQTTAGQLNAAGGQAAGNVGNILLNTGQQIGNDVQNAGAARASGYVGGANALTSGLAGLGNAAQTYSLMNLLNNPTNGLAPYTGLTNPAA